MVVGGLGGARSSNEGKGAFEPVDLIESGVPPLTNVIMSDI